MADLSLEDFTGTIARLRNRLPYYDGKEQDLNDLIIATSELVDELKIIRDWTCLANEFRRDERSTCRTRRLGEYAKVMIKENNRPEEERKPFADLRHSSISTNLLVATASETRRIIGFSGPLVKYIIKHGDKFIQARQLCSYFIYVPYCQVLCSDEKISASIEIWGKGRLPSSLSSVGTLTNNN
jgi:hypothetical protein